MPEHMYGRLIFDSNAQRDEAGRLVEDLIQGRVNVIPRPHADITQDPSGVEYRNNFAEGPDSGPAVLFSVTVPDQPDPAWQEAHALFDQVNGLASGGSGGFSGGSA